MSKKILSTLAVAAFAMTAFHVQAASHASAPKPMMDKKDAKPPVKKEEAKK